MSFRNPPKSVTYAGPPSKPELIQLTVLRVTYQIARLAAFHANLSVLNKPVNPPSAPSFVCSAMVALDVSVFFLRFSPTSSTCATP